MEQLAQFALSIGLAYVLFEFYCIPANWASNIQQLKFAAPNLYGRALVLSLIFILLAWALIGASVSLLVATAALLVASILIGGVSAYLPDTSRYFIGRQLAQMLVLLLLVVELTQSWEQVDELSQKLLEPGPLVIALAYLLILSPSSKLLALVLQRWSPITHQPEQNLPMAGQAIGMVERSLVVTCVLLHQFAAIGFIVAAKSIFRFGDLTGQSDRKLTEYVMLGTLLSVAISVFTGLAAHALYDAFS
ncbi:DUF3307 domain-containing protein [Agarivorans sp. Toyoura001]|uniref:DUF3307 domain-containing protein n=1 Tax=unclassified Agarivorans TaxID=2636026 RepID=UPI0010E850D5|nr:DUF3307 domain-containing protein [Agarivorans sp. Toyoura001]GDY25526.1 hypothetical protein AHAT_14160 [Agarivorans sp. Toyoura001]